MVSTKQYARSAYPEARFGDRASPLLSKSQRPDTRRGTDLGMPSRSTFYRLRQRRLPAFEPRIGCVQSSGSSVRHCARRGMVMIGTKPVDGAIELLPELHLCRVRV